ncbi:MAG: glycine cleavage T C-terminal barrel domain-containing protein, partial [Candidatus Limnocylindria bacterium]
IMRYQRNQKKYLSAHDKQIKERYMATSTPNMTLRVVSPPRRGPQRRRRVSPESGHALEILAHAIEYLTDEYIHQGGTFASADPQLEAVQLLMAKNREVYFSCPEVPTLGERIAMAYLPAADAALGAGVEVLVRDRPHPAEQVKLPFYRRPKPDAA